MPLVRLPDAEIDLADTLVIPPIGDPEANREMLERLAELDRAGRA
jgi:hypothetical protein